MGVYRFLFLVVRGLLSVVRRPLSAVQGSSSIDFLGIFKIAL